MLRTSSIIDNKILLRQLQSIADAFQEKMMKVNFLSITPAQAPNSHEVLLSIGEKRQIFRLTTEVNQVGNRQLQTTQAEPRFSELFRFNQLVAMNVSELVVKYYNQEVVELPADVGNFVTPEEAVSNLKPFAGDRKPEMGNGSKEGLIDQGKTEEMNQFVNTLEKGDGFKNCLWY